MKLKRTPPVPLLLTSILVAVLLVVNLLDLADVLIGDKCYSFGSEFFSSASIYHSKAIYISYSVLFILLLVFTISSVWLQRGNQKWIYLLVAADGFFLFYPVISNA